MKKIWNFKLVGFAFLMGLAGVYAFNCNTIPPYTSTVYKDKDIVWKNGLVYKCIVGGWCGIKGYEPGSSLYWDNAWTVIDTCTANTSSSTIQSSSSLASSSSVVVSSSVTLSSSLIASSSSIQLSSSHILSSSSQTTNQINTWIKNNVPTSGTKTVILPTGTYTNPPIKINSGVQIRYTR